jgi:dinuclear metal center YbgI/SA1388 family protein
MCLDLVQSKIACFSAHTNLDVVPGGVNSVLADRIGLVDPTPLFPVPQSEQVKLVAFVPEVHLSRVRNAVCSAGAGVIGDYTNCSFSTPGIGTFRPGDASMPFSGKKKQINEEPERKFEVLVLKAKLPAVLKALFKSHPYDEVAYDIINLANHDASISLGLRGELSRPTSLDAFASRVRKSLSVEHVRVIGSAKRKVKRIAVMGGSGGSQIADLPDDVDVFVTGDVKYHEAELANLRGITVIDAGHAGTEKCIVPVLASHLRKHTKGIVVRTYTEPDYFRAVTK